MKNKQWPSPKQFRKLMELIAEKYNYLCFVAGEELSFAEFIKEYANHPTTTGKEKGERSMNESCLGWDTNQNHIY